MIRNAEAQAPRTVKLLRQAANTIEYFGWTRDVLGSEAQGFCVLGALSRRASMNTDLDAAICAVADHLGLPDSPDRSHELYLWNDEDAESGDEVVRVLRATADGLQS